jgi:N-acetyl-anhydromuramyl-L-alanine amidase AmpD
VYSRIRRGAVRRTSTGELVRLRGRPVRAQTATARRLHLREAPASRPRAAQRPPPAAPECPRSLACRFDPAAYAQNDPNDPGNYGDYDLADRPRDGLEIRYLVIHDTEETFADTLATFQNPLSFVSAHYVVRSSDGLVDQMVPTRDVAWHAGNWYVNTHSVGIENEGFATEGATWFSEPLYRSTARLVRYLAQRYGIPLDREHVVGHDDVPGPGAAFQAGMHWDPGPYWNWSHFMRLAGAHPAHGRARLGHALRIAPSFGRNSQTVTYCDTTPCRTLPPQDSNFVYLHSGPSFGSPLIADEALAGTNLEPDGVGTTQANDWGDKAVTGRDYYLRERRGGWARIDYGGKAAWFFDPHGRNTRGVRGGTLVTPKRGADSIAVYGAAYPSSRPAPTLQYTIPAGQVYVAKDLVRASYYSATTFNDPASYQVITEPTRFYEISFNHRIAYVRADDVRVLHR